MGHVYVRAKFIGKRGERVFDRVMVDTGATYSVLPPEVAEEIGVVTVTEGEEMEVADGRVISVRVVGAEVEIEGRRGSTLFAVIEGSQPLIGVLTLERLGFRVDPVEGRLEPTRPTGRLLAYGGWW